MRSPTPPDPSRTRRRPLVSVASASIGEAWHTRALREATTVRRLLRGTRVGRSGVIGETRTIDALERGAVTELLLTPRFAELRPGASLRATQLAAMQGARTTRVTGLAAFELDLAAEGIGAVLRRSDARHHDARHAV